MKKRSIRLKAILYFLALAIVLIAILWITQEWFFSTKFIPLKKNEVIKIADKATDFHKNNKHKESELFLSLYSSAYENNLIFYYFTLKTTSGKINVDVNSDDEREWRIDDDAYSGSAIVISHVSKKGNDGFENIYFNTLPWNSSEINRFFNSLINWYTDTPILYSPNSVFNEEGNRLYYAVELDSIGENTRTFLYMEAILADNDITVRLVRAEFVIISLVCLVLTCVFAIFLGAAISNPIIKISKKAREMVDKNYNVKFDESSYTEINNLTEALNYATNEIRKTERYRRDFMANVTHELRTPLTMVKAYAEMIRDISGGNEEKRKTHAQVIIDEADRLSHLVGDIQELSRLQAGTEEIDKQNFDIGVFVQGVVNQFSVMHEKFGFKIETNITNSLIINADKNKISQVMYNLISNALYYTNQESKYVRVEVAASKDNKKAIVRVIDTGKGIQQSEIDHVWEKYYRSNLTKRNVIGSGLGLSIVKSIFVAHEAEYGIESELGKGSTFWFALPIVHLKRGN